MSRERMLRRRLRTLETLDEAVGALRALSAQQFRVARGLLSASRGYRDEITAALGVLHGPTADREGGERARAGIIVIAADLGLVGDYSTRLAREALALRDEHGPGPLICLGQRAVGTLERAGLIPDRVDSAPTSIGSLPSRLLPLADEILSLHRTGQLASLWLVAARFEGVGHFRADRIPVLPVVVPPASDPITPSPYTELAHLRMVMVREYLYATLYGTWLEALASEHGKRLVMAESARSWLADRIAATRRRAGTIRREQSTQEILEIVTAARSLQGAKGEGEWMRRR
jgi:F0F1-type ATP synthase gamma subunit